MTTWHGNETLSLNHQILDFIIYRNWSHIAKKMRYIYIIVEQRYEEEHVTYRIELKKLLRRQKWTPSTDKGPVN